MRTDSLSAEVSPCSHDDIYLKSVQIVVAEADQSRVPNERIMVTFPAQTRVGGVEMAFSLEWTADVTVRWGNVGRPTRAASRGRLSRCFNGTALLNLAVRTWLAREVVMDFRRGVGSHLSRVHRATSLARKSSPHDAGTSYVAEDTTWDAPIDTTWTRKLRVQYRGTYRLLHRSRQATLARQRSRKLNGAAKTPL